MLFSAVSIAAHAQLTQFANGTIDIKRTTVNPYAHLTVNTSEYAGYSDYNMGIICDMELSTNYNMGIIAFAKAGSGQTSGYTYGVVGTAGNATNGYNYGIFGRLNGIRNGAAIAGTVTSGPGFNIPGKYAAYFNGDCYVNGSMTNTSSSKLSDIRRMDNVTKLTNETKTQDETLMNVMNMNVIKYNYIDRLDENRYAVRSTTGKDTTKKRLHYGLSAQELRLIYPDLVHEGQDGYLAVSYVELIPILVRCIQELKQRIDQLESAKL